MNIIYPTKVLMPHALIYRRLLDHIDVRLIEAKERNNKIENNISLTHEEEIEEDRVKCQYYENLFNPLLRKYQDSEDGEEVDSNGRPTKMSSYNWYHYSSDDDDKEIVVKTSDEENLPEIKFNSFYLEDSNNLQLNYIKDSLILNDKRLKKATQKRNERKLLSAEKKEEIKTYDKERKQQKSKLYSSSGKKEVLKDENNISEPNDEPLLFNKEKMSMEEKERERKQIAAAKRKKQRENKKYKDLIYNKNNIAGSDCSDDCEATKKGNNNVTKIDDSIKVAAAAAEDIKKKKKAAQKKKRQRERKKERSLVDNLIDNNYDSKLFGEKYAEAINFQSCAICSYEDGLQKMKEITPMIEGYFISCGLQELFRELCEDYSKTRDELYYQNFLQEFTEFGTLVRSKYICKSCYDYIRPARVQKV